MQIQGIEKRRFARYPVDKDMQVIWSGRALEARLKNVSDMGVGILFKPDNFHLGKSLDTDNVAILRCEVGNEIIDVSLEVRHFRTSEEGVYIGFEVVTKLQKSLWDYIENHMRLIDKEQSIASEVSVDFLNKIRTISNSVFSFDNSESLVAEKVLSSLQYPHWTSYIALSSKLFTTRIYLNYQIEDGRKFGQFEANVDENLVHDFMRERTNIVAGSIKRWVLSHGDISEREWGNFDVRMPCTEELKQNTCEVFRKAKHAIFWQVSRKDGSKIMCFAFLQVDDPTRALKILDLLSHLETSHGEDDDVEFL